MNLLSDLNMGHEEYEIDNLIAGSGVTQFGVYHQCLREIYTRVTAIKAAPNLTPISFLVQYGFSLIELRRFVSIAVFLKDQLGDVAAARPQLVKDRVLSELRLKIAMQVACFGGPTGDIMAAVMVLPKNERHELVQLMSNQPACLDLLLQDRPVDFTTIPTLTLREAVEHIDDHDLTRIVQHVFSTEPSTRRMLENHADGRRYLTLYES